MCCRSLEHSNILYESPDLTPLLRVTWNKQDNNYLATMLTSSPTVVILDVRYTHFNALTNKAVHDATLHCRMPSIPLVEMTGHGASVNGLAWAPNSACHLCSVSDDQDALIWDITSSPKVIEEPILSYSADAEINMLQWDMPYWVGICYDKYVQVLRV
jgi:WD repeat-containing protein 68